jgi:quinol monooxygenase YgiN
MHPRITIIAVFLLSLVTSCTYTSPYRRMGGSNAESAIVTLTAVEHKPGQRGAFFEDSREVIADLRNQSGLLGYSFRFQLIGRKAWTMTSWKDEASRDSFASSPVHRAAVKNSRVTAMNMSFISVEVPVKELPMEWPEALLLLDAAPAYE